MITEKEFKERCAEILRKNITFSHQVGDYVIHGALDSLWKLHTEQNSHKHDVMQAGSDGAKGATVGQRSVGTVAESQDFYCADWNRCGAICEEQCPRCKKAETCEAPSGGHL